MRVTYVTHKAVLSCVFLIFSVLTGKYTFGQKDSLFRVFYYPDSIVSSKGYFVNGQPDGFWENFHPNGKLKSEGKRTGGQLDSIWKFYDAFGCINSEISYLNGKKNGYYFTYETFKKEDSAFSVLISKELYLNDTKQGKSYYYHFTGYQKEVAPFENGKKHGTVFHFDSTGTAIAYSVYRNGVQISYQNINRTDSLGNKVGIWKEFHSNGEVKEEAVYEQGSLSGYTKRFNRNGQLLSAQLYQKDSLISDSITELSFVEPVEYLTYFGNGQPRVRGLFKDSIPVGVHRVYDSTGTVLSSIHYSKTGEKIAEGILTDKGLKQGLWTYFYPNGLVEKSGNYRNSKEYGDWKFYYPDGLIREKGNFSNGKYSGAWTFFHENGSVLREIEYFDGLAEGLCTEYDDSSRVIAEGMYLAGMREGNWKIVSGTITKKGQFRSGEKVGLWKYVYHTGNERFTGEYRIGRPQGKHKYFYEDGTLEREEIWKSGKKDKVWKHYRPDGSLELMIFYKRGKERQVIHTESFGRH